MAVHPNAEDNISSLLNDLSKIGIVLECREDIVLFLQRSEKKFQELKAEIVDLREKDSKKNEELLSLMTKDLENRQKIIRLEKQVQEHTDRREENIYEAVQKGSVDRAIQSDIIHSREAELEKQLIKFKKENVELSKQVVSTNEEIKELRRKVDRLPPLFSTSENGGKENNSCFEESDEEMVKLTKLKAELSKLQRDNFHLKLGNDELKEEVVFLRNELSKAEFLKKQRDQEYNFALEQVSALKKEKSNLMEELEEKVKEIHDIKGNIANLQVEKDKDAFQVELGVLRNQKERSNLEVISLREELGLKNGKITEMERVIRDLKDRQTPQETTENESLYAQRDNALRIRLEKVDVNGSKQFGIFLASRPSRVLITDAIDIQKGLVRAGDYILSINGVNVQNATNEFVWNLTKDNHMDLVLLRPVPSEQEHEIKNQEKGLRVEHSLKVSHLTTAALNAGIRIGDEIIKINDQDVQSLTVSKIEEKISKKSVRLYIRRTEEIVQSIRNVSSGSFGSSLYETIDDTNSSARSQSGFRRGVMNRSRVSMASSHSSSSRSTNVVAGQLEHQRRGVIEASERASKGGYEVARETPKRQDEEEGYVDMRGWEQEQERLLEQHGRPLSNKSKASLQIGDSFHGSSDFEQECRSSHSVQSPPLPHRPAQALPDHAVQASGTDYHYVDCERNYSMQGQLLDVTLKKSAIDSSFGFTIFGGNRIGIFVDQVDCSSPAGREAVPKGARIVSINDHDVTNTALCFAAETIRVLEKERSLKMKILTQANQPAKLPLQRPYDLFTVRALVGAPKMSGCTLPFNENDILTITDTYENFDPKTGAYLWHATKTVEGDVIREGSIPAEQSMAVPFSDDKPGSFEARKEKPGILKVLRKKPSSEKIKDIIVFPLGHLYEYMDDSIVV